MEAKDPEALSSRRLKKDAERINTSLGKTVAEEGNSQ